MMKMISAKKIILCVAALGVSIPILMSIVMENIDVDSYLNSFSTSHGYVLKKGDEVLKKGNLGDFLYCLKKYKGMNERNIKKEKSNKYEAGLYHLLMSDGSVVNLSVSGGKAHSFDVKLRDNDWYSATGPYSVDCYLSSLK